MNRDDLLPFETPLIFADGTTFWNELAQHYTRHDKGLFIAGPSGVGKSHFTRNQAANDWVDGDVIWDSAKAAPAGAWWLRSAEDIEVIDQRSDIITQQAKMLGFWIIGASVRWLKPDALVLPDWETHKKYIKHREENGYDGGAKSDALDGVLYHRDLLQKLFPDVPVFQSVDEAVAALTAGIE